MGPFTLVVPHHDRTPDGYRREIDRLRKLVENHPDDDGYKLALEGAERTLKVIESTLSNKDECERLLANIRDEGTASARRR